jgi:hypothetical protein
MGDGVAAIAEQNFRSWQPAAADPLKPIGFWNF